MLGMLKGCSKCPFNFYCLLLGFGLKLNLRFTGMKTQMLTHSTVCNRRRVLISPSFCKPLCWKLPSCKWLQDNPLVNNQQLRHSPSSCFNYTYICRLKPTHLFAQPLYSDVVHPGSLDTVQVHLYNYFVKRVL